MSLDGWVSGDPAPVQDRDTGTIWLPFCRNLRDDPDAAHAGEALIREGEAPRDVWITSSDDDGATWSEPREITAQVKCPGWTWTAWKAPTAACASTRAISPLRRRRIDLTSGASAGAPTADSASVRKCATRHCRNPCARRASVATRWPRTSRTALAATGCCSATRQAAARESAAASRYA